MAFTTRLFVGNLPDNLNEDALREAFSSYGNITNFDLKTKPGTENDKKKFAFITLSASNFNIESCIKHFSNEEFYGNKLYVTRARESFLERLQREREQANKKEHEKTDQAPSTTEVQIKTENYNFQKRKFDDDSHDSNFSIKKSKALPNTSEHSPIVHLKKSNHNKEKDKINISFKNDEKKQSSDIKRLESMKKKRQEFNEKKNIIKSGLISIDKKPNKKVIFSDTEDNVIENDIVTNGNSENNISSSKNLFDDDGSDDEINFEIKEQFEGKKGQKVLDLQSRYKSDKRFILDERFVEDESDKEENIEEQDQVDLEQADEKSKQLNILQDVLGIEIKTKSTNDPSNNKTKHKLGMLRFDPMQPDHAKYLAPVEVRQESNKKSKKKKSKEKEEEEQVPVPEPVVEKVEVSKEQFYKISDTLKEAITQPNAFSLRSLFSKDDTGDQETQKEQEKDYVSIKHKKDSKVKNPLDLGEKNPFVYDSSESENEDDDKIQESVPETSESKPVWREKLFFSADDLRFKDALLFFSKKDENIRNKERRELKSLMKKRIYNKERKNTMFQKKIGGRKKIMKKKFKKNK